jgi:hypothetical protein
VGWHEDMVGEYHFEQHDKLGQAERSLDDLVAEAEAIKDQIKGWVGRLRQMYITRNMIDIEPRYLVGLAAGGFTDLDQDTLTRLRRIAGYIMSQADTHDLITFKKVPDVFKRHRLDKEYHHDGNWRDSEYGHLMVHPVIAPYDVNVVFYPQALRVIQKYASVLGADAGNAERLIKKWDRVKDWYRFKNVDGKSAFALALYDVQQAREQVQYKQLKVNHTDEAYEMFYGQPLEPDVASFCRRLVEPSYFYTSSGPTIVGAHDGYTKEQYHGRVIWTKQTAYVAAGLERQLEASRQNHWSAETTRLMRQALAASAEASLQAFHTLQAFPELYIDVNGPRFYSQQPRPEGIMNTVQLWSAVGARRIMLAYKKVAKHGRH